MRQFLVILLLFFSFEGLSQQGLQMNFGEVDSSEVALHRQIEYFNLINGSFEIDNEFPDRNQLPKYSFDTNYGNPYKLTFAFYPQLNYDFVSLNNFNFYTPLHFNREVLSSAAYELGNKFVVGGFSYGANSPFSAVLPNQASQLYDNYGSTIFMQYKVSKKFRIETSVSLGQHQGPLLPGF